MPRSKQKIDPQYEDPDAYGRSNSAFGNGKYPPDWDARRQAAYDRDDHTCQDCGVKTGHHADGDGVALTAHHKISLSDGGTNALSNLESLCLDCHEDAHPEGGPTQGRRSDDPTSVGDMIARWRRLASWAVPCVLGPSLVAGALGAIEIGAGLPASVEGEPSLLLVGTLVALLVPFVATIPSTRRRRWTLAVGLLVGAGYLAIPEAVPGLPLAETVPTDWVTRVTVVAVAVGVPLLAGRVAGLLGLD